MANERVKTGISGLDELLQGGFPQKSVVMVSGPAGSAKSLFSLQFLYNGAKYYNENGVYITVEESRENLLRACKNYNMELEALENEGRLYLIDLGGMMRDYLHGEEDMKKELVGFATLRNFLDNFIPQTTIKRLVIDSLTAVGIYYRNHEELREELFRFCRYLKTQGLTSVLITESVNRSGDETRFGVESFMSDGFIALGLEKKEGEYRRSISILKMRFTKHDSGAHPFIITGGGIEIASEIEM